MPSSQEKKDAANAQWRLCYGYTGPVDRRGVNADRDSGRRGGCVCKRKKPSHRKDRKLGTPYFYGATDAALDRPTDPIYWWRIMFFKKVVRPVNAYMSAFKIEGKESLGSPTLIVQRAGPLVRPCSHLI